MDKHNFQIFNGKKFKEKQESEREVIMYLYIDI